MESKHHCTTCTKPCTKESCSAWFVQCPRPRPPPCETCVKPLYDIITYCNVKEKEFNVIINTRYLPIQGFILAFVDEYGNPIIFDDYNSFMKIESITPYPNTNSYEYPPTYNYYYREICPFSDKNYYTYTIQAYNCMPINPALWSYYININVPLKLSFKLDYNYTGNVFLYINMFFPQQHCAPKLEPIISNCIRSDQELSCVYNPFACGYISWMTDLQERPDCPPTDCNNDYPYNT
jgi:hypothetical protein